MRILIYEAMPDIKRADVISRLGNHYEMQGHSVFFLLDEDVHLFQRNSIEQPHIVNCLNVIRSIFPETGTPFFATPRNPSQNRKFREAPTKETLEEIKKYKSSFYRKILQQFRPDNIVIWNGLMDYQSTLIDMAKMINPKQQFLFLEAGWFPQKETYYFDPDGVNAASSLSRVTPSPLNEAQKKGIRQWKEEYRHKHGNYKICDKGYYFIPLQLESDTNITLFSPFKSMRALLEWVIDNTNPDLPIVARPHPLSSNNLEKIRNLSKRLHIDKENPLQKLIAESHAVIGINSTVLLESLIYEKPTIALGQGVFQSSNAVHIQNVDKKIPNLSKTKLTSIDNQEAFLHLLKSKQHKMPPKNRNKGRQNQSFDMGSTQYSVIEQKISKLKIKAKKIFTRLIMTEKKSN